MNIGEDKEFISNEFLNFYMELETENKKSALNCLKEKGTFLAEAVSAEIETVFSNISCVRINFKQDMMAVLFLKYAPPTFRLVRTLLDELIADKPEGVMNILGGDSYDAVK